MPANLWSDALCLPGFGVACLLLGATALAGAPRLWRPGLLLLTGLAIWSGWLTLFGWAGHLRLGLGLLPLVLVALASATVRRALAVAWRRRPRGLGLAVLLLAAIGGGLLAMHPPHQIDATTYHLPLAAAHVARDRIDAVVELRYPAFPQLVEVAQSGLLLLGSDRAAHAVGWVALLAIGFLLLDGARAAAGRGGAALAAAVVLLAPQTLYHASSAYVDVPLAAFMAGALHCLTRAATSRRPAPWLVLAALFGGATASIKYTGLAFAGLTAAWLLWLHRRRQSRGVLRSLLLLLLAAAPWYLWNWLRHGDPIAPFGLRWFGSSFWAESDLALQLADFAQYGDGRSIPALLALPFRLVLAPERFGIGAPPNPLLPLLGLPAALVALASGRPALRIGASFVLLWVAIWFARAQIARYLLPVLPPLAVIAVRALAALVGSRLGPPRRLLTALTWLALAAGGAYVIHRVVQLGPPPRDAAQVQQFHSRLAPTFDAYRVLDAFVPRDEAVYGLFDEDAKLHAGRRHLGCWFGRDRFDDLLPLDPAAAAAWLAARGAEHLVVDLAAAKLRGVAPLRPDGYRTRFESSGALLLSRGGEAPGDWQELREPPRDLDRIDTIRFDVDGPGALALELLDAAGRPRLTLRAPAGRTLLSVPPAALRLRVEPERAVLVRCTVQRRD